MKALCLVATVSIALWLGHFVGAATITVTNSADSGTGSLRQALATAQNGDTIVFNLSLPATISLTSAELVINASIGIIGPGPSLLTVARAQNAPSFPIFRVTRDHTVVIQGMTMTNGSTGSGFGGAGIYNDHSNLTLNNCALINNAVDHRVSGGAITSNGELSGSASLTINNSILAGNSVAPSGTATFGGAIFNYGIHGSATLIINNSTISNNYAFQGGGLFNDGGVTGSSATVTISNSTFTGNYADQYAGAIMNEGNEAGQARVTVSNSTFAGNSSCNCNFFAGDIFNDGTREPGGATLEIGNSIFKGGLINPRNIFNQGGVVISHGYNVTNDAGVLNTDRGIGDFNAPTDQVNTEPMLDPAGLQNNGGPTQTIALLPGSPAINSGDPSAPSRDQRSYLRDGPPDRGAFESGGTIASLTSVSRKTHGGAGTFDVDLPLSGAAGVECRSGGGNGDHQLIMTFATPVTLANASVTSGVGNVSQTTIAGSQVTIDLTGVTNAQQIELTLFGVSDGANMNNESIPMGVLLGDVNSNGAVNATDVGLTKSHIGEPVLGSNFRADVNANGDINASDVGVVKSRLGTGFP